MGFKFIKSKILSVKELGIIFGAFLALLAVQYLYSTLTIHESANNQVLITEYSGVSHFVALISIAIIPAIIEEYIFRGYILSVFFKNHLLVGTIISSILFAILHQSNNLIGYLPFIFISLVVSLSYLKTKNLLVPITIHFLNNAAFVVLAFSA